MNMSIIYCEKHDRKWDSDKLIDCPICENTPALPRLILRDEDGDTPFSDTAQEGIARAAALANNIDTKNAKRYYKLRRWMSSNVPEGWCEVKKLAAIACYTSWEDFDAALDVLPECNVGLCQVTITSEQEGKK